MVMVIVFSIVYYYDKLMTCSLVNSVSPGVGKALGCSTPTTTNSTSKTAPPSQIINNLLGNNPNAEYKSQYAFAENITKKYNETIKKLILFTGNSSNKAIEMSAEEEFSVQGSSVYVIKYGGFYVPTYENISDEYFNGSSYLPSLLGKVVYVEFVDSNYNNSTLQIPYKVQSETIDRADVSWYLTQATGIPNSTAINILDANNTIFNKGISGVIGIYYNGTEILFPAR